MATMFSFDQQEDAAYHPHHFDVNAELAQHGWRPEMGAVEAEALLEGEAVYTYLLRPNTLNRKFAISFVQPNGTVKHDTFTLIDPKYGIWRNGFWHHVGSLAKVIRDMMDCDFSEGQPLS